MKTKNFLLSGVLGIALAGAVLTGCNKSDSPSTPSVTPSPAPDYSAAEDDNNAATTVTDTKNIVNAAAQNNTSEYGMAHTVQAIYTTHCTTRYDSSGATDSIIVSFGTAAVNCNDGRWRQGDIIVYWPKLNGQTFKQAYFTPSSVLTLTFKNFAVGTSSSNMVAISGSCADTNKGNNNIGEQNWSYSANLNLHYTTGQTASWISSHTNTLVSIGGVYYYEIAGTAHGTSRTNVSYTLAISPTNPIYTLGQVWTNGTFGCEHFEAGTITMSTSGYTISIDYGSTPGTCPSTASVNVTSTSGTNDNFTINLF